jgi:hypothetical protein
MYKKLLVILGLTILTILGCTKVAQQYIWDITQNQAHTLTASSKALLERLEEPLTISVYSPDINVLSACKDLLERYRKHSENVIVELHQTLFHDTEQAKLNLYTDNNLLVTYKNARHAIDVRLGELSEKQISSLIQKTSNAANHWLVFVTGHQEADPLDHSELGLSSFAEIFTKQGMNVVALNLAEHRMIPDNTALLIVANPQLEFLPFEQDLIHQYLEKGGKLLWLTEPGSKATKILTDEFGIKPSKGVAIDPTSVQLGSPHPALKIITKYPAHAITANLHTATIMPWSAHLQILAQTNNWQQQVFLTTEESTWSYNGPETFDIKTLANHKEHIGPLNLGIALSRNNGTDIPQRSLLISDSSFLINKYLPLYANAQLAASTIEWTQEDVKIFVYSPTPLRDLSYHPSKLGRFLYHYFFIFLLPLLFIGIGLYQGRRKTG